MTETLTEQIVRHEGLRLSMYRDSLGIETIGVGHNLRDKPISNSAAMAILEDDLIDARDGLFTALPWVEELNEARRNVLINMSFNLGIKGLLGFTNMLTLINLGDYRRASEAMLKSKWAVQTGKRAKELANIMLTGEIPNG